LLLAGSFFLKIPIPLLPPSFLFFFLFFFDIYRLLASETQLSTQKIPGEPLLWQRLQDCVYLHHTALAGDDTEPLRSRRIRCAEVIFESTAFACPGRAEVGGIDIITTPKLRSAHANTLHTTHIHTNKIHTTCLIQDASNERREQEAAYGGRQSHR
jgi:hypothetical protein